MNSYNTGRSAEPDAVSDTCSRRGQLMIVWTHIRFWTHVVVALLLLPFVPLYGPERTARIVRWWHGRALRMLGIRLAVDGHPPKRSTIIVANHCSWLDIMVLGHVFDTVFISKAEVDGWPVVGRLARAAGTLFLPRGAGQTAEMADRIGTTLQKGRSVVLFPEATTTRIPVPRRFHARLFAAAVDSGADVLPVGIRYADANTPANAHHEDVPWVGTPLWPNFLTVLRLRGLTARVVVNEIISPDGHDRRQLAEASRQSIAHRYDAR